MAKKRSSPEASFQIRVLEYMALAFPAVWVTHVPSGGKRDIVTAAIFKKLGVKTGVPDLLCYWNGGARFGHGMLELKAEHGYLSPAQKKVHNLLGGMGVPIATCKTLDDVRCALRAWGAPCREDVPTNLGKALLGYEMYKPATRQ